MSYYTKMNSPVIALSAEPLTHLRTRKKHYLTLRPGLPSYCTTKPQTQLGATPTRIEKTSFNEACCIKPKDTRGTNLRTPELSKKLCRHITPSLLSDHTLLLVKRTISPTSWKTTNNKKNIMREGQVGFYIKCYRLIKTYNTKNIKRINALVSICARN